jgi:phage tail-like protein
MATNANQISSLLGYLPAILQEDREGNKPHFLGRFLLAFEKVLLGIKGDTSEPRGLEEVIARIYRYFEPGADIEDSNERAPQDFLPWLAGWLALTLREDWDERRRRDLIAKASELYRLRGTRRGVEEFLKIYTLLGVWIEEFHTPFQIGVHSKIGTETYLSGGAPFFFHVHVVLPTADLEERKRQYEVARTIIDLQKPAHTYYDLTVESPILQIGVHSTVGTDTLLGEQE